ncbi:MAG: TonB-dependent receptor [Pseudomonadales bacterium]|nr:TonB-dependent receptor [Pseudomonadales bacterium]
MSKKHFFNLSARKKLAWSVAAAVVALGAGAGNSAFAADDEEEAALEEITVTGSRIRRDDFSNAQPTTVVGGDLINSLGLVNIGDAMAQLPSNVGNNTPTANAGANFFNGSNIANLRGLNPFFGSRTLTLVDSRRHVPTNQGDGVDLNFIPSILIDRMEVVTGGASASYGSGAIGGVTNVLLNRRLEGGKFQADYGNTDETDGADYHYGLAYGAAVGEAGHFVIGFESQNMKAITGCAEARDWCARAAQIQTNTNFATNDLPNFVFRENATTANINTTGVFPLLGQTLDESGTGTQPFAGPGPFNVGGDGRHPYLYTNLRSNINRQVLFAAYDHEINDKLSFFAEGSYGDVDTLSPQGSLDLNFGLLQPDNFYLNQLENNPCAGFPGPCFINKDFSEQASTLNKTGTEMYRFALGFSGSFWDTSWTWDAYYQYGRSERVQAVEDNRHAERFNFALDAVDDGNGNAVCRVTRDGVNPNSLIDPRLAEGCVPINIFGTNNITPEAFDFAFGRLQENTNVEQDIIEIVASGEVFSGFGAGPVRAAIGGSYRDEKIANIADESQPDHIRTDYLIQYGETFGGDVEVFEFFAELDVPVTDRINIQGAVRRSEYTNTAGIGTGIEGEKFDWGITTWKVNGNWNVTDWMALRGSQSRDIRAPNFRELYYGQIIPSGSPFGFCSNQWTNNLSLGAFTFTGDPCVLNLKGGLEVQPEKSDTTTVGIVLTPTNANVRLGVDLYRIKLTDAITPASVGLTLDGCFFDKDPVFCSRIDGELLDPNDPVGGFARITQVNPEAFNFATYNVKGMDITADWVGEFGFGTLSTRIIANRTFQQLIQPNPANPGLTRDIAGVTGATNGFLADWAASPKWTGQWITSLTTGPVVVTTQARFVRKGRIQADRFGPENSNFDDKAVNSIDDNTVPDYVVWSLNGSYGFTMGETELQLFASIQNLFDKDPPLIGVGAGGTNPTFFDTIGRNFRVGMRANF